MKTTWRLEILNTIVYTGDSIKEIEFTLTDEELDEEFDGGYGGSEGKPFTGWSENWVYFPVVYDGSEWVGYVPRNPNGKATKHQGGE